MSSNFPLLHGISFLNHGSYGCAPCCVEHSRLRRMDEINSMPDDWCRIKLEPALHDAHIALCNFLHLSQHNTVFVENTTTGINTVLKSLHFGPSDAILYTNTTYGSVVYICEDASARTHCSLVRVDLRVPLSRSEPILTTDEVVECYERMFCEHPEIRVAIIDVITSGTTILLPTLRLIEVAHRHSALALVDGAHAPGHIPLDLLGEIVSKADFFVGNLHKWMYTCRSCAMLSVRPEHQRKIEPLVTAWNYPSGVSGDWQAPFFMLGTRDWSTQLSVLDAIAFYEQNGGLEAVQRAVRERADRGQAILLERLGPQYAAARFEPALVPPFMRLHSLPAQFQPSAPELTGEQDQKVRKWLLDKHRIVVTMCGVLPGDGRLAMRTSAQLYTSDEDFERLAAALPLWTASEH